MYSSIPFAVNNISRYAFLDSDVLSTLMLSKRFVHVGVLSSAARIPLPGVTIASAISCNEFNSIFSSIYWFISCLNS